MTKSKHNPVSIAVFIVLCILFYMTPEVPALEIADIYPTTPTWQADERYGGTAEIVGKDGIFNRGHYTDPTNPDTYVDDGNGSLELKVRTHDDPTTTLINESSNDWGFYVRNSDPYISKDWDSYTSAYDVSTSFSWGLLSEIDNLSFDWFRQTDTSAATVSWDPWWVQTPALRLLILNSDVLYELVWEAYYDFEIKDFNDNTLAKGNWVYENLIEENFWMHVLTGNTADTYSYFDYETNSIYTDDYTLYAPYATTLYDWRKYFSNSSYVYGLSVGVGSGWREYTGYVDNVLISFNDGEAGFYNNFEIAPVPEPATLLLFGSGMGIMAAGRRWRNKRTMSEG